MTSNELHTQPASITPNIPSPILTLSAAYVIWRGKKMLNFASHDYLGISQHPDLKKNAAKALLHYGSGTCFAEATSSYIEYQKNIEDRCNQALGVAESRFLSSRTAALSMLFSAIQGNDGLLLFDNELELLLQKAARVWSGKIATYSGENLEALEDTLSNYSSVRGPKLIFAESLSSSSGTFCDLTSLYALAKKNEALILIDDTNAFGVRGIKGLGLASPNSGIDFLICAMDRGAGATGALLASNFKMNLLLKNSSWESRENALPYSSLGAIDAAFELIPQLEGERKQLEQRCHWLKNQFKQMGIPMSSSSHFFCFSFSEKNEADALWSALAENEILAERTDAATRHIVRLVVNSSHTPEDLMELISFFKSQA